MRNLILILSFLVGFSTCAFAQGPLKVDLRPLSVPVKDFGKKEEKSLAYTLVSAIEMAAKQSNVTLTIDADKVFKDIGNDEMKKQIKNFKYKDEVLKIEVDKYSSSDKDLNILKQLDKNKPVILTMKNVPYDLIKCASVVVASKKTKSDDFGVLVLGYTTDADPMLLVQNAEGSECGENGFQYMPLSMCSTIKKINCESFVIEKLDIKILATPTPTVTATATATATEIK